MREGMQGRPPERHRLPEFGLRQFGFGNRPFSWLVALVEPDDPGVNLFGPEKAVTEVTHPETPYTTVAGGCQSDPCCDGLSALIEKLSPWDQSRPHLVDEAGGNRLPVGRPDSSDDVRNLSGEYNSGSV